VRLTAYSAGGVLTETVGHLSDDVGIPLPTSPRGAFNMSGAFDPGNGFVRALVPALLISYGDPDTTVSVAGALALEAEATAVGLPNELHVRAGRGHTDIEIFSIEVAPGETLFERFATFFHAHVASDGGAALAVPAVGTIG
jgi:hypothetical protein